MIQTQMTKAQWEKLNAMASIATVLLKEDLASARHDSSPYRQKRLRDWQGEVEQGLETLVNLSFQRE
jgi:hypothetical protein